MNRTGLIMSSIIIAFPMLQVSGSSAKVIKDSTYHHFTLLLDVDMHSLRSLLQPSANVGM